MKKKTSALCLLLLISSCAHVKPIHKTQKSPKIHPQKEVDIAAKPKQVNDSKKKESWADVVVNKISSTVKEATKVRRKKKPESSSSSFKISYTKKHYDFWINYFTKREEDRFKRFLKNGAPLREMIENILVQEGLPKELYFVGLVESGYNLKIKSHASAVGPWQFIRGTAKRYGLKVNRSIDERYHPVKATRAAAHYFKDLYNIFGSWELAMAAYNAGEYRIINAIRKGNTRDFKTLVKKKLLPKETILYVPKVAAAKFLANNHYPKLAEAKNSQFLHYQKEKVRGNISIADLGRASGLSKKEIQNWNPDLKWAQIHTGRKGIEVYFPGKIKVISSRIVSRKKRSPSRQIASNKKHRVRKGENLSVIARRYGMTVSELKKMNGLRRSRIFVGQKLKVSPEASKVYVVRKGDNLYKIAKAFGIPWKEILRFNNLSSARIYPRQSLRIPAES